MNKTTYIILSALVFCLGLIIGWRATMLNLNLELVSPCRIEVSAWGQTDLYVFDS